jgi:hypothetical protein
MSITSRSGLLLGLVTFSVRVLGHRHFVAIDTFGVVSVARKRGVGTLLMAVFCLWFKMYVSGVVDVGATADTTERSGSSERVANQAVLFVETAKTDTASNFWEHVVGLRHRHDVDTNEIYKVAKLEGRKDKSFLIPLVSDRSRCFLNPSLESSRSLLERFTKQREVVRARLRDRPLVRPSASSSSDTHEIAATTPDWPAGVEWPGVWEACSILREGELTCDIEIECDGMICKNVEKIYVRKRKRKKEEGKFKYN